MALPTSQLERHHLDVISVGEFFREINWYGHPSSETNDFDTHDVPYETVGHFFATFPWYGTAPETPSNSWGAANDDKSVPVEDDTLTLEDLSALF